MRVIPVICVAIAVGFSQDHVASRGSLAAQSCSLVLRGSLSPASAGATLTMTTGGQSIPCTRGAAGSLCTAIIGCDAREAVLTVAAPGFKTQTRNIAPILFRLGSAQFDIGVVRMRTSELPRIPQIIQSRSAEGSVRFEIVLRNPSEQELLIHRVVLEAFREPSDAAACMHGGIASFELDDEIELVVQGNKLKVTGRFQEVRAGAGFSVRAHGEASVDVCGGKTILTLALPTAFTVPKDTFASVDIHLPPRFKGRFVGGARPSSAERLAEWLSDPSTFDRYVFRFSTIGVSEGEFSGTYWTQRDSLTRPAKSHR